jgi:hypothetical protein
VRRHDRPSRGPKRIIQCHARHQTAFALRIIGRRYV